MAILVYTVSNSDSGIRTFYSEEAAERYCESHGGIIHVRVKNFGGEH